MNCQEFASIVTDLARNEAVPEGAAEHAAVCRRCAGRLAEEQALTAGLRACSLEAEGAPARVEAKVLEAFRRRHARKLWPWPALAAASALLLALAILPRKPNPTPDDRPKVAVREAQPPPPMQRQPEPPKARPKPISRPAPRQKEVATEFFPLMYGETLSPLEGRQLVRVRLPRSALVSFGFPINEDRGAERINADVLLGEDGLARAIRFVK